MIQFQICNCHFYTVGSLLFPASIISNSLNLLNKETDQDITEPMRKCTTMSVWKKNNFIGVPQQFQDKKLYVWKTFQHIKSQSVSLSFRILWPLVSFNFESSISFCNKIFSFLLANSAENQNEPSSSKKNDRQSNRTKYKLLKFFGEPLKGKLNAGDPLDFVNYSALCRELGKSILGKPSSKSTTCQPVLIFSNVLNALL